MSTALVIIFNHNYEKNIPILENLYSVKFTEIFFLVPFYRGERRNVISVSGNSFYFHGYISQASPILMERSRAKRFLFVSDDLILNPRIDQTNVCDFLGISENANFIPSLDSLENKTNYWSHALNALRWTPNHLGIEVAHLVPKQKESLNKLEMFGTPSLKVSVDSILPQLLLSDMKKYRSSFNYFLKYLMGALTRLILKALGKNHFETKFPFYYGYSDIFIVTRESFVEFSWYLGLFSATNLFVELAIPTSLALSSESLETELTAGVSGQALWQDNSGRIRELEKYSWNFQHFIDEFPENCLYVHPIKLSKWRLGND